MAEPETLDVIIIGAGLTGINSAYRLQKAFPSARYAILEGTQVIGGTWAFWKFPGVRSDSSLPMFGLPWHPWPHEGEFAAAPLIRAYLEDAAKSQGIDRRMRFGHRVVRSSWSTDEQLWTVRAMVTTTTTTTGGEEDEEDKVERVFKTRWLVGCGGYYDYDKPLATVIPGIDDFGGEVVHPQFWTEDRTYAGKKVVVVGSGATAITMLPVLADKAEHVTMLQRSPSYVLSLPGRDDVSIFLKRWLPARLAVWLDWWRRLILEQIFVGFLLNFPDAGRRTLVKAMAKELPEGYPVDVHFNPKYDPFNQRLCLCPDADFFKALHRPNCEVVTDVIDTVTETGIRLKSGKELEADMIITATGLHMELFKGHALDVDGVPVKLGERYVWRGVMIEGVPNSCAVAGYTTGTWTPGADIHFKSILGVMKEMKRVGATSVVAWMDEKERAAMPRLPALTNSSGYIVSALDRLPLVGGKGPWYNSKNWVQDSWQYWVGGWKDGLKYTIPSKRKDV